MKHDHVLVDQGDEFIAAVHDSGLLRHGEEGVRLRVQDVRFSGGNTVHFCDVNQDGIDRLQPKAIGGDNAPLPTEEGMNVTVLRSLGLPVGDYLVDDCVLEVSTNGHWEIALVAGQRGSDYCAENIGCA